MIGSVHERACLLALVERNSGLGLVAKLPHRTTNAVNRAILRLIRESGLPFKTTTWDNGTEFHGYKTLEEATGVRATSPIHTDRGSAAATRTSTACSGSTSRSAGAWPNSSSERATTSRADSTFDRGNAMATRRRSNDSKNYSGGGLEVLTHQPQQLRSRR